MGPTKAKERSLQAQRIEQSSPAPYHRLLYSTSHCQSRHHAEHPRKPSASSKAVQFHITARRTPPVTIGLRIKKKIRGQLHKKERNPEELVRHQLWKPVILEQWAAALHTPSMHRAHMEC